MLIDIEKIEEVMKARTINDLHIRLFNKKLNNVKAADLTTIKSMFIGMNDLVWKAGSWNSSNLAQYHSSLACSINETYSKISSMLEYNFGARYLTDKFAICMSFYSYLKKKKAV